MRHRVIRPVVLGLVAAFLLAVGAAAAKMPYFSVEVSPPDPVDGGVVTIVVRMWDDARHTQPATWGPESPIEGLLEFRGDAGNLPITLVRVDESSYAAEVTLPEGTWRLIPFPRPGAGIVVD
nr:hypothetical protein [Chloroflexota bacterium]